MALSIDDFKTAIVYPCGKKKACKALWEGVPGFEEVKEAPEAKLRPLLRERQTVNKPRTGGRT